MAYFAAADTALASLEARVAALEAAAVTPGGSGIGDPFPPEGGVPAMDYCHGDGTTDDTAHILSAIAAAAGAPVYFLDGTYLLSSTLTVPDGTTLVGESMAGTHLKGAVVYGSDSSFADLKIGDVGKTGIVNGPGASGTTFTRCQFRGGGTSGTVPLRFGGGTNDAQHITFVDCNVERNLGVGDNQTAFDNGWNNVAWSEGVGRLDGSHMEYICFTRCHFGVSNGRTDIPRNIGSPRFNVELYCYPQPNSTTIGVRHGWHNVEFRDCIFEAADMTTLNIPNAITEDSGGVYTHDDTYCIIDGCTIYGGGVTEGRFPNGIAIEGANHVTINDCDIYPAHDVSLAFINSGKDYAPATCNNWTITNNRFHFDDDSHNGGSAHSSEPYIILQGRGGVFAGNTVRSNAGANWLLWMGWYYEAETFAPMDGCTFTDNEFHELRTTTAATGMVAISSATNCTITGNTFQTAASSDPTFSYRTSRGPNTGTTIVDGTNNTLVHG